MTISQGEAHESLSKRESPRAASRIASLQLSTRFSVCWSWGQTCAAPLMSDRYWEIQPNIPTALSWPVSHELGVLSRSG